MTRFIVTMIVIFLVVLGGVFLISKLAEVVEDTNYNMIKTKQEIAQLYETYQLDMNFTYQILKDHKQAIDNNNESIEILGKIDDCTKEMIDLIFEMLEEKEILL